MRVIGDKNQISEQRLHQHEKMRLRHNLTAIKHEKITVRVPQDANHLLNLTAIHVDDLVGCIRV